MEDKITHTNADLDYAVQLVHATCCLAGSASYLDDGRADLRDCGIMRAIKDHDTPALFGWLVEMLSFQGISDWSLPGTSPSMALSDGQTSPKGCHEPHRARSSVGIGGSTTAGTTKGPARARSPATSTVARCRATRSGTAASTRWRTACSCSCGMSPTTISSAGLTVNWMPRISQLPNRLAALREAIIGPLRNVYGVSDKVLAMALSNLLLAGGSRRLLWVEVGATFVAVDTLVHNFLHRTGILQRLSADHPYGDRCYGPGGCAQIIDLIAAHIDARHFNPAFPATFPRFVQSAIWRYCAENGLDVCNGNRIDDNARCDNLHCQLFRRCDRLALRTEREKVDIFQ